MKNAFYMESKRCLYKLYFLLAVLLWLPAFLSATDVSNPAFRSITISDGLSNNIINTIYKDKRGFVWLGTQTGLDRFDGIDVVTFPQFAGQTVFSVVETDSVNLWIGTDSGLKRFDREKEVVESIAPGTKVLSVKTMLTDKSGRLLAGTTAGLFVGKNGGFKQILFDANALSVTNSLTGIMEDVTREGMYWISSANGLIRYDIKTDKIDIYKQSDNEGGVNSFSCLALRGDTVYLGTANQGMFVFDRNKEEFFPYTEIGNGCIKALLSGGKDILYVGTNGGGIKVVRASDGEILSSLEHSVNSGDGICSNAIYSLLKVDDQFYVGTYMGGLSYTPTRGDLFSVYSFPPYFDSRNQNIRAFRIGENGEKMIGTREGLYYISEKKGIVRHYTHKTSLLRSDIIIMVEPFKEDYLIGTYGGGLYLLHTDSGQLSFFKDEDCFKQGSFSVCDKDKDGKLWLGSSNGIYVYDMQKDEYTRYHRRNSALAFNSIFSLKIDSKNRVWVGTAGAVFSYDPGTGVFNSNIFPENMLPYTKSVRYIYEDGKKNLWFCDDKQGVLRVDEHFTKYEHFTTNHFLPSNSVMSIVESPTGEGLWFSTQRGLLYAEMNQAYYKLYSLYDGIPGYIFNYPVQITADNTIWWGNEHGLVYYTADAGKRNSSVKRVCPPAVTSVAVAGKVLHAGDKNMPLSPAFMKEIELSREENISFTFSALNYAIENTDIYEYCMEGYEDSWKILMKGNRVSYSDLPAGTYLFKVRSASHPEAVQGIKVNVVQNFSLHGWILIFSLLVCSVPVYYYSGLLSKYKRMKRKIQEKPVEAEGQKEKYLKSRIDEKVVGDIKRKLSDCMEKDKLYLNPDLKLQDVAKAIGCATGELSQVLNLYLEINFTDFINQYRVEEFIKRVQDKSAAKYTLASLSEQCGFSSRTSFFRSFKKQKGKSPAEYIKEKGVNLG